VFSRTEYATGGQAMWNWRGLAVAATMALSVSGCASVLVPDSTPLAEARILPPGSATISSGGYRHSNLSRPTDPDDRLIILAMSGGGKRSAAFSYGALKAMREMQAPSPSGPSSFLSQVAVITGISGGSFTAAYYGLHRDAAFGRYEQDFLYRDTNSHIFGIYLLPWNWTWISDPAVGTNDFMERVYDQTMFHGATYGDLTKLGRPMIALGATDISYGQAFAFTQEYFDLICSDLEALPLSRAVAASNGFPGLFSPVTLTNHRAACGNNEPGWLRAIPAKDREDPLSRLGEQARVLGRYLDPEETKYVHLADGGITDNLGLRIVGGQMQAMAASPAFIRSQGYDRLRRIVVISIDGEGAQDTSVARSRYVGGVFSLLGLVSGAQIDRYNFETMTAVTQQLRDTQDYLRKVRCAEGRIVHGAPCDDVTAELIHVSLAGMPAGPDKDKLLAIPTGLTLEKGDVDALVAAGEKAVRESSRLRDAIVALDPKPVRAVARR